jgi:hypothetical protein
VWKWLHTRGYTCQNQHTHTHLHLYRKSVPESLVFRLAHRRAKLLQGEGAADGLGVIGVLEGAGAGVALKEGPALFVCVNVCEKERVCVSAWREEGGGYDWVWVGGWVGGRKEGSMN